MIPVPPGWVMLGRQSSGAVRKRYDVVGWSKKGEPWVYSNDDHRAVEWLEMYDIEFTTSDEELTWELDYSAVVYGG